MRPAAAVLFGRTSGGGARRPTAVRPRACSDGTRRAGRAPEDAQIEVGASHGRLYIEMRDGVAAAYRAHHYVCPAASSVRLVNDGFHIASDQLRGRGFGLRCLCRQVTTAASLGIDRIELIAGRRVDENGYYTWPRYGFEAMLPRRVRPAVAGGIAGCPHAVGFDGFARRADMVATARRDDPRDI